jgi:hypothetical protein
MVWTDLVGALLTGMGVGLIFAWLEARYTPAGRAG